MGIFCSSLLVSMIFINIFNFFNGLLSIATDISNHLVGVFCYNRNMKKISIKINDKELSVDSEKTILIISLLLLNLPGFPVT